jgi:hypothetical protein
MRDTALHRTRILTICGYFTPQNDVTEEKFANVKLRRNNETIVAAEKQ